MTTKPLGAVALAAAVLLAAPAPASADRTCEYIEADKANSMVWACVDEQQSGTTLSPRVDYGCSIDGLICRPGGFQVGKTGVEGRSVWVGGSRVLG